MFNSIQKKLKRPFAGFLAVVLALTTFLPGGAGSLNANAAEVGVPEQNTTYTYAFKGNPTDGVVTAADGKVDVRESSDGLLTVFGNGKLYYHGADHGLAVFADNKFEIKVAGNAKIRFDLCQYSKQGTIAISGGAEGSKVSAEKVALGTGKDEVAEFIYVGDATTLTFTLGDTTGQQYLHSIQVVNTEEKLDITRWEQKNFDLMIGNTAVKVEGAASKTDAAKITMNPGSIYYALAEKAYVVTDLQGDALTSSMVTTNSNEVVEKITVDKNIITVLFKDQTTYPYQYSIQVQDQSNYVTPGVTDVFSFDFANGDIPKELNNTNKINSTFTTDNGIVTIGNGTSTKAPYYHGSHGIDSYTGNYIDVVVSGDSEITFNTCQYSKAGSLEVSNLAADGSGSFDNNSLKANTEGDPITYTYQGSATTLRFTINCEGSCYLHGMTVKNTGKLSGSTEKPQASMPTETDSNDTLSITPYGHKIIFDHTDSTSGIGKNKGLGYYLFDASTGEAKIEADIVISAYGTSDQGLFFGAFQDGVETPDIATIGFRGGGSIRNFYSKNTIGGAIGTGGITSSYKAGETIHVVIERTSEGIISTVKNSEGTVSYTQKYSTFPFIKDSTTPVKLGFAFSKISGTIRNLTYSNGAGEVLYSQTDCYEAIGTAPTVTKVEQPTVNADRTELSVTWSGATPEDDGAYQVELSSDGGKTFKILAKDITEKSYTTSITTSGDYVFRISGVCGEQTTKVEVSPVYKVLAPLDTPEVSAESGDQVITVNWNKVKDATQYEVYKRSSEETKFQLVATTNKTTYEDKAVTNETPYYYYVIAKSADNESNPSNTTLSVPSAGHVGDYAYEKDAAEFFITKKSYDTVYTNEATLEGLVNKKGILKLEVNDKEVKTVSLDKKETFTFKATLVEGRNDVTLYFTDELGNVTKKAFNFVYLTNYDIVVDGSFTGVDGSTLTRNSEIKVFKTVQAAVDSVPTSNTERVVILVKEGSYREYLTVNAPNITLIGEDRDLVNINFYDPVESPEGGDTTKRAAVRIKSTAKNFTAENLSFENTYEYLGDGSKSNESADAIRVDADNSVFVNVKLLGYQDTLQSNTGHQYFYKCYITGNVDFIYGTNGQALFEECEIVFRYNGNKNSGYVIAPKTDASLTYGYIFNNCSITSEAGCSGSNYLLGRPWGPDGAVTFINTYMGQIINKTKPYNDMSGNLAKDARFFEYYTYGPGFAINSARPQISEKQAEKMLTTNALGWDPYTTVTKVAEEAFIGTIETVTEDKFIENEYVEESADPDATDDSGLGAYNQEGFAASKEVTGGGVLLESSSSYYQVGTAEEFLAALANVKKTGAASVIELTNDIGLGSKEIGDALTKYSSVIKAHSAQALLHPTLIETGVSMLLLKDLSNLTIFSKNGASIEHACVDINNSSNIIIRNIVFDELWEWDEETSGDYDRNDWDYITIENGSTGIWIDHCTFYKAYDGIIDLKKAISSDTTDVTISWSQFLPESEGTFFDEMMDLLEASPESYPYYNKLLTTYEMTKEQVRAYAAAQKKTHLVGASDTEANMKNLQLTLANNYYKNSMDRMPRLRAGNAHVYNCILDSADILALKESLTNVDAAKKVVSNGAISTVGAQVLLENTVINGIQNAIVSGNADSSSGYIGAKNVLYFMRGKQETLTITDGKNIKGDVLELDAEEFIASLPYGAYKLYDASALDKKVVPYSGAGVVEMNGIQWMKTSYNDMTEETPSEPGEPSVPSVPSEPSEPSEPSNPSNPDDSNNGAGSTDSSKPGNDQSGNTTTETPEELPKTGVLLEEYQAWFLLFSLSLLGCGSILVGRKRRAVR